MTSLPCLLAYLPTRLPTYFNPLILHPPHHPLLIPTFMPTNKPSQTSKKVYPHLFFPFFTQICAKVQRSTKCFFFSFFKKFHSLQTFREVHGKYIFFKVLFYQIIVGFYTFFGFFIKIFLLYFNCGFVYVFWFF